MHYLTMRVPWILYQDPGILSNYLTIFVLFSVCTAISSRGPIKYVLKNSLMK